MYVIIVLIVLYVNIIIGYFYAASPILQIPVIVF